MNKIQTIQGQFVSLFTREERDFYVNVWRKSPDRFTPVPNWVLATQGLKGEFYAIPGFGLWGDADKDGEADFWKTYFLRPEDTPHKPGFMEIFTNSRGKLHGSEIRMQVPGNVMTGPAVAAYNNQLEQDEKLYTEDLDMVELRDRLLPDAFERLQVVHDSVSKFLEAPPVYFEFEIPTHTDGKSVEFDGVRYVLEKNTRRDKQICFAFPGKHALVRDLFHIPGYTQGGPKYLQPGRDRWYRELSHGAFATYLHSPIFAISNMQIAQAQEGRPLTKPLSPILLPEMFK